MSTTDGATDQLRGRSPLAGRYALLAFLALAGAAALVFSMRHASAQEETALFLDANVAGSSATSVPSVEDCFAPEVGESFYVDLVIKGVDELLGWSIYIDFDPDLLEVVGRDVDLFQGANEGSSVYDVSDPLPGTSSPYQLAAADVSDPPTPDSGTGVLGRLTFQAKAEGVSALTFTRLDFEGDGTVDRAPFLRNAAAEPIGDEDGDGFFDGDTTGAEIAIGGECDGTGSSIIEGSNGGGSSGTGMLIAIGAGGGVLALAVGAVCVVMWRRRNGRVLADT